MNITKIIALVFDYIHTILLLAGLFCVVLAISLLTNIYYGLLALGVTLIVIAILIEKGG